MPVVLHADTNGQATFWMVVGVTIVGSKIFVAQAEPKVVKAVGTQTTFCPSIEARVFLTQVIVVKLLGKRPPVMLHAALTVSQRP